MNTNLLSIVKQIIAQYGEGILSDPARLKAFFSDLARNEPKPLRMAFGRCVENGAYLVLKTTPSASERAWRKEAIAQRLRDEHGLDPALCAEALDVLEAALYGTAQVYTPKYQAPRVPARPQAPAAPPAAPPPVVRPSPPPQYQTPPQYQQQPQPQYQQPYYQAGLPPQPMPPQYQPGPPQPYQPYQAGYQMPPQPAVTSNGKWVAVLVLNILGLNFVSRFITGHIGTGILVLLLDIVTYATLFIGIGLIGLIIGLIIWIVDLVTICSKKWRMADGTYLVP